MLYQKKNLLSIHYPEEVKTDFTYVDELSEGEDLLVRIPSTEKFFAYLSVGGLKSYTGDILCG